MSTESPEAAWYRCASFFMSEEGERWIQHHQCNRLLPPYVEAAPPKTEGEKLLSCPCGNPVKGGCGFPGCSLRAAPPKTEVGEGAHGRGPISDRELADMVNAINTARNAGKSVLTIRTQDAATLFEKLAAAEAKNAELERHARIALDCGQNVDAQNERLRGKCSRQRKELRRLNEKHFEDRGATLIVEARAKEARADCLKMSGIAAKAYEDTNKLRAELSALREQNESLERKLAGAQHCTDEQAEEIDTLRAKEADVARKQR